MDRFAWPWVLVLLVAVPLAVWRPWRRPRGGVVHPRAEMLAASAGSWRTRAGFVPGLLRAGALALMVVALARPQAVVGHVNTSTEGVAIEIVVDRSSSMEQPMRYDNQMLTRLEVVKRVAGEFVLGDEEARPPLPGRPGDLIGLIAFAGYADTICPLVRGHEALAGLLAQIDTAQFRGEDGTAIGDALMLAAARLKDAEEEIRRSTDMDATAPDFTIKSKVLILLTDGQNHGRTHPDEAARLAAQWGVRIYTIGIGGGDAQAGGFPSIFSRQGVDSALLERISSITDGQYFAADDAETLRKVYERIDAMEKTRIQTEEFTDYRELFGPLAAWALACLSLEVVLRTLVLRRTA
jgi:Ca-activated chloride channel family protein